MSLPKKLLMAVDLVLKPSERVGCGDIVIIELPACPWDPI